MEHQFHRLLLANLRLLGIHRQALRQPPWNVGRPFEAAAQLADHALSLATAYMIEREGRRFD